jgi:hypothetical protein
MGASQGRGSDEAGQGPTLRIEAAISTLIFSDAARAALRKASVNRACSRRQVSAAIDLISSRCSAVKTAAAGFVFMRQLRREGWESEGNHLLGDQSLADVPQTGAQTRA